MKKQDPIHKEINGMFKGYGGINPDHLREIRTKKVEKDTDANEERK